MAVIEDYYQTDSLIIASFSETIDAPPLLLFIIVIRRNLWRVMVLQMNHPTAWVASSRTERSRMTPNEIGFGQNSPLTKLPEDKKEANGRQASQARISFPDKLIVRRRATSVWPISKFASKTTLTSAAHFLYRHVIMQDFGQMGDGGTRQLGRGCRAEDKVTIFTLGQGCHIAMLSMEYSLPITAIFTLYSDKPNFILKS